MRKSGIWAVVPVKDIEDAKQRLAGILAADERADFFRAMLLDVLSALSSCPMLVGTLVVSRDHEVIGLARRLHMRVLTETANRGQTTAVMAAAHALSAEGAAGMIAIPADVPLIIGIDVGGILHAHRPAPAVTIAPARDRLGSNAVVCSPPHVMPLRFGDNSFFPHLASARNQGIEPVVVHSPAFALDIDRPDDLLTFIERPSHTRAYAYLQTSGVADRLRGRERTQSVSA